MNWLCIDGMCCSCKYSFRLLHQLCIINTDAASAAAAVAGDTDTAVLLISVSIVWTAFRFSKMEEIRRTGLYKVCIDFWGYWSFCHFSHSQKWTGNREIYLTFGIVWKWIFIELVYMCVSVCAQMVSNSVHVHHIRMGVAKRKSSLCNYSARKCYVYERQALKNFMIQCDNDNLL